VATGRSFAEFVKNKCFDGLYEAAEKYVSDNQDTLDLRVRHVSRIGYIEFVDANIQRVYVCDLPGMRVAFDVGIELELCVHDANHRSDAEDECHPWIRISCEGDLSKGLDDWSIEKIEPYNPRGTSPLNSINMVLGLFGECSIEVGSSSLEASAIRLDWDILPPGDYPWEIIKGKLEDICKDSKQTQKQMMLRNCNLINECNPDFIAYGRSGFRGYIVFGFCKKNLFFLESIFPNNATYIFESDWEELSKLTKSEILNHNLQKGRLIHNANWPTEFEKYMNANG